MDEDGASLTDQNDELLHHAITVLMWNAVRRMVRQVLRLRPHADKE